MSDSAPPLELLADLEDRHDDVLRRLSDLNQEVERVLHACQGGRGESPDAPAAEWSS